MPRRPLIGIGTAYRDGVQRQRREYGDAVAAAGGTPVLLPLLSGLQEIREMAARLDGLVIPGGPGITPWMSGCLPDDLEETAPERMRFDEAMARTFLDSEKPILGICYGMQLLSSLTGGTLYADVEKELPGALVHSHKRGGEAHPITIEPDTKLAELLGAGVRAVNTRHIQAVREESPWFRVTARSPDGVVEAFESDDARIVGVQFHPELMDTSGRPLFQHLVQRASA